VNDKNGILKQTKIIYFHVPQKLVPQTALSPDIRHLTAKVKQKQKIDASPVFSLASVHIPMTSEDHRQSVADMLSCTG
jgi:hypothetical protein